MHKNHISQIRNALFDRRTIALDLIEVRAEGEIPGYSGYASTFWAVDSYGTAMAPGAFKRSVATRGEKLPVLWQHDPDAPVGRHLTIKEDKQGLFVDVALVDDGAEGTVALARLRGGVPMGLSFGFNTIKKRSATKDDPLDLSQRADLKFDDVEVITDVRVWETSLVTFAANEDALINAIRSEIDGDAHAQLLGAIRTGRLTDDQYTQLADAWTQRPGPAVIEQHSTPEQARRNRDVAIVLALAQAQGYLSEGPQ